MKKKWLEQFTGGPVLQGDWLELLPNYNYNYNYNYLQRLQW